MERIVKIEGTWINPDKIVSIGEYDDRTIINFDSDNSLILSHMDVDEVVKALCNAGCINYVCKVVGPDNVEMGV